MSDVLKDSLSPHEPRGDGRDGAASGDQGHRPETQAGRAPGAAPEAPQALRDSAGLIPLTPGSRVRGTITGITDYGAFVVTDEGRRGLIHISEITDWYVERAEDYFYKGERVEVAVVHFDPNSGKYAFSTRRLGGKQPLANRYADRLLELHRYGTGRPRYRGFGRERDRRPFRGERHRGPGTAGGPGVPGYAAAGSPSTGTNRPAGRGKAPGGTAGTSFRGSSPASHAGGTGAGGAFAAGAVTGGAATGPAAAGAGTAGGAARVPGEVRDAADLLRFLRRHVGQVSPAARMALDRLVQAYGAARVAVALAQVLEGTDRSLQVVEAAGQRLAGGSGA